MNDLHLQIFASLLPVYITYLDSISADMLLYLRWRIPFKEEGSRKVKGNIVIVQA